MGLTTDSQTNIVGNDGASKDDSSFGTRDSK